VNSGLIAGDRVVVEGIQSAKPGTKVVAEEYKPPPTEKTVQQAGVTPPTRAE